MGLATQAEIEAAARLFGVTGKVYIVRVGRYRYVRLQLYTADLDEQRLIVAVLGGRFMDHMGRRHMWEASSKVAVKRAVSMLLPYVEGSLGVKLHLTAQWAFASTIADRNAILP